MLGENFPVHIHISEQQREVQECQAIFGTTPIELLAHTVESNSCWNLVHATHATEAERRLILQQNSTVVLCPVTEAYLGDGLFAADEFDRRGWPFRRRFRQQLPHRRGGGTALAGIRPASAQPATRAPCRPARFGCNPMAAGLCRRRSGIG